MKISFNKIGGLQMEELIRKLMEEVKNVQNAKEKVELYDHHYKELVKIELVLATALEDIASNCYPELMRIERSIKETIDEKESIKKELQRVEGERMPRFSELKL